MDFFARVCVCAFELGNLYVCVCLKLIIQVWDISSICNSAVLDWLDLVAFL